MNLINAIVDISPQRLNFPLRTLHARQLHSFNVQIDNIPDDVTSVVTRVYTAATTFVDVPVSRRGGAAETGYCYIIGNCFPAVGQFVYEIHAYDFKGNMTALGRGTIDVETFTISGEPITPGASVPLTQIRDANGNYHAIVAVPNSDGEYTAQLDPEVNQ